jgi:glycosyltransferase involved in cell wall biosynthesis
MKTSRSHILIACHAWYRDSTGGSFRLASEFADYLSAQGNLVSYVCCANSSDWNGPSEEVVNGVHVFRYRPDNRRKSGIGRLRFHLRKTRRLVQYINARDPVQYLSGHSPLQSLGAVLALTKSNLFFNYTVHSPFDDELLSNNSASPGIMQRIASMMARRVDTKNCRFADRVQCDSRYTLSTMSDKHHGAILNKGIVAPGWVDAATFRPAASRHELRNSLGNEWCTELPLFFTLRRLENRMGLDTLVDACRILRSEGLRFRTLIGGGGSLKAKLQLQIDDAGLNEHVKLLGRLPEEILASTYAAGLPLSHPMSRPFPSLPHSRGLSGCLNPAMSTNSPIACENSSPGNCAPL